MIEKVLERYFDGAWMKYVAAWLAGCATQRFFVVPRSDSADVMAFGVGFAICGLVLGLRWLNNR